MTSTFLDLHSFVRPPRLLVVVPQDDDWVRWSAAALGALSRVWGGCASALIPAGTAEHPALSSSLDKLQPDHIVAYQPTGATVEALHPGTIERMLSRHGLSTESRTHNEEHLRTLVFPTASDPQVEEAATRLRNRYSVNTIDDEGHIQCTSLPDEVGESLLTPLSAVAQHATWGAPLPQITSPAALSFAMQVGVEPAEEEERGSGEEDPEARWREAVVAGEKTTLRPDAPDDITALLNPQAARCIRISRGRYQETPVIVLGDQPEDFALAQLSQQVHGNTVWLPWEDLSWHQLTAVKQRIGGRLHTTVRVTSASLTPEAVRERMDTCWDNRGWRVIEPAEEEEPRPYDIATPADLTTPGRSLVVLSSAWDQPKPVPVEESQDGSLTVSLRMPPEVPPGLDPIRHRWQVGLTAPHPLPPHHSLFADALLAPDQNIYETFVRAADGGITYWSHRWDFVPSGASLAGSLAGPRLAWPSLGRILSAAAKPHLVQLSPASKRARIAQQLVGSRTQLEDLAAADHWELLCHWRPGPRLDALPQNGWWQLKTGVVLSWTGIAASPEPTDWPAEKLRAQIDTWTAQGVLRRGLVLGCSSCPIYEFYPVGEINQHYACRRCGSSNTFEQQRWKLPLEEPQWYYELHPAIAELIENDGNYPLLATRHLRSQATTRSALVTEEFELLDQGNPYVEFDFAVATLDALYLGEAKKNDTLGKTARITKREVNKLLKGSRAVGATHLVLATPATTWKNMTLTAVKDQIDGDLRAGEPTPHIVLLTGLGGKPTLTALDGSPFTVE
ncbi:hypothetical protein [Streptomyces sp. 184]|uniref:hypothetical protein n=1 Tax=Streptomyces sp. 184 TaxID=1827526 RepID=UPI00389152BB